MLKDCRFLPAQRPLAANRTATHTNGQIDPCQALPEEEEIKKNSVALGESREQGQRPKLAEMEHEWKQFAPRMECPLFHTTAFLNDYAPATALIDNGSMAYAIINEKFAQRLKLPFLKMTPRQLRGVQESEDGGTVITNVTAFSLDIGAHKSEKVFAYVVPQQSEELILGRPWIRHQGAYMDEKTSRLVFPDGKEAAWLLKLWKDLEIDGGWLPTLYLDNAGAESLERTEVPSQVETHRYSPLLHTRRYGFGRKDDCGTRSRE